MANFDVAHEEKGEVSVLNISGYLDAHTAPDFENALTKLLQDNRFKIVVNLQGLQYISSAGLGVFMGFIEEVREKDGDIKLSEVSEKVFKVFDLLGFPSLYEFYDETEKAVEKFSN